MAIRIDLLPAYVRLRRNFRYIAVACGASVVVFAGTLFLIYYKEQLRLQTLRTNLTNIESFAKQTEAAEAAATAAETEAKPMQDSVNFMVDASRTGPERAALLDLIHRYVYADALVGKIDISDGQNVKMTANVATPDDYSRFLLNLRRGAVTTGVVFSKPPTASGIKGWPQRSASQNQGGADAAATPVGVAPDAGPEGEQTGGTNTGLTAIRYRRLENAINVDAVLREPIVVPQPPGGAAAAPAGGVPGMPGGPEDAPPEPPPA